MRSWAERPGRDTDAGGGPARVPVPGPGREGSSPGQMLVKNQRRLPVGTIYTSFQTRC